MKKSLALFALAISLVSLKTVAAEQKIKQTLDRLGVQSEEILSSPIPGIKTVFTAQGVLYMTDDGKYLLQGPMFDVGAGMPQNATNTLLNQRVDSMQKQMIVYPAKQQKYVVTVFTDVTCGYCRKLHQDMQQYNNLGITVRYLAFPRQGPDSTVAKEMESIWCSTAPRKELDIAMQGKTVPAAKCNTDITQQYQLGVLFGLRGTPAIVLSDGTLLPGYQDPQSLLKELKEHFVVNTSATNAS